MPAPILTLFLSLAISTSFNLRKSIVTPPLALLEPIPRAFPPPLIAKGVRSSTSILRIVDTSFADSGSTRQAGAISACFSSQNSKAPVLPGKTFVGSSSLSLAHCAGVRNWRAVFPPTLCHSLLSQHHPRRLRREPCFRPCCICRCAYRNCRNSNREVKL
jgi:hypothetical protein